MKYNIDKTQYYIYFIIWLDTELTINYVATKYFSYFTKHIGQ